MLKRVIFVGLAAAFAAGIAAAAEPPQQSDVDAALAVVRDSLKDPDSAKFRRLQAYRASNGTVRVCGELNSKNSYGGYNGFTRFAVSGAAVTIDSTRDAWARARLNVLCLNGPEVPSEMVAFPDA